MSFPSLHGMKLSDGNFTSNAESRFDNYDKKKHSPTVNDRMRQRAHVTSTRKLFALCDAVKCTRAFGVYCLKAWKTIKDRLLIFFDLISNQFGSVGKKH